MFRKALKPMGCGCGLAAVLSACVLDSQPSVSINELMITRVTPSTNALWGAEDPQTDNEWAALDAAAIDVIQAFEQVKRGGAGPKDSGWAAEPQWQVYADEVIAAGRQAQAAIASRNLEDLWSAGEILYPPCENCHNAYHPGSQ